MPNYPTSLDTITSPAPSDLLENATDILDHHAQHNNAADILLAIQGHVGINDSNVVASLDYLRRTAQLTEFRPSSPDTMDDEFDAATLDAKWTALNMGTNSTTETLVFDRSHAIFGMPACSASDKNRLWVQTAPAGVDWMFAMKCCTSIYPGEGGYFHTGFGIYDTVSNKHIQYGQNCRAGGLEIGGWAWNYPDSYVGNFGAYTLPPGNLYLAVKYNYTADDFDFFYSYDGKFWTRIVNQARSTYLSNRPNRIGISIMGSGMGHSGTIAVDWFRRLL
jgi:hypothetical protein